MPDGNLHFIGRVDHTVKIRGFRVDLQDVEKALLLHPDVSGAAVVLSDSEPGSAMLLAFFALRGPWIRRRLPGAERSSPGVHGAVRPRGS